VKKKETEKIKSQEICGLIFGSIITMLGLLAMGLVTYETYKSEGLMPILVIWSVVTLLLISWYNSTN